MADGTTFGLWSAAGVMPFQPSNGILFAVDDLDAAVAAIKARDIPVHMEHETPVCFMAMISDTEGNSVVLHKRKTSLTRAANRCCSRCHPGVIVTLRVSPIEA